MSCQVPELIADIGDGVTRGEISRGRIRGSVESEDQATLSGLKRSAQQRTGQTGGIEHRGRGVLDETPDQRWKAPARRDFLQVRSQVLPKRLPCLSQGTTQV